MSALADELQALESANLVQAVTASRLDEFAFRHTLIQETAYASLLKSERSQLHGLVGRVLEASSPPGDDDQAARLAHHFEEAGELDKALAYYQRAGEHASTRYANWEASELYARALDVAASVGQSNRLPGLYSARGHLREIMGDFDGARADFEQSLAEGLSLADAASVWQAQLSLGGLWASRDYARTQAYYEQALRVARSMDDPAILAHTLNRVGNLETNTSLPLVSEARHQEALEIFRRLGDEQGLSETLDFLSMASYMGGKVAQGSEYGREAARLFLKRGDDIRLISSLGGAGLNGPNLQTAVLAGGEEPYSLALQDAMQAARLADNIGWRSGSSFSRGVMGSAYGMGGEFGRALDLLREAVEIADSIGHEQWSLAAKSVLGLLFIEMLNPERALEALESAARLADRSNSLHWHVSVSGSLARVKIRLGAIEPAQREIDSVWPSSRTPRSLAEAGLWLAKAEWRLAAGQAQEALTLVQALYHWSPDISEDQPVPLLGLIQGKAFKTLRLPRQAREVLEAAASICRVQQAESLGWQIDRELAASLAMLGESQAAQNVLDRARRSVDTLAASIEDPDLAQVFLERALGQLGQDTAQSPDAVHPDEDLSTLPGV